MERSVEIRNCGQCHKPIFNVSTGEKADHRCARCQYSKTVQAQPDIFQGTGTPMVMPTVEESLKRTLNTLNLIEKEEKKQGLSMRQICQKEASEQARNQQSLELSHQKAQQAKIQTQMIVSEYLCQKRSEEIQNATRQKAEYFKKCFREINENEGIDWKKVAEELRQRYYAKET